MHKLLFGQYVPGDSILHGLDSRTKILSLILLSTFVILSTSLPAILFFTAAILALVHSMRLRLAYVLRGIKPFLPIFAMILAMYLLFSPDKIQEGLRAIWRFGMFILLSMLLTASTQLSALVLGLEKLLWPMSRVGISPRTISLLITLTVRFIPVLFMQAKSLHDARIARLGSLRSPRQIALFFGTLLEKMLRSASTVSDAILARGYADERRSSYLSLRFRKKDYAAAAFVVLFGFFVLLL